MSAQSIAKAAQGYEPKPVSSTCGNCERFKSDRVLPAWRERQNQHVKSLGRKALWGDQNTVEKNLRCTLGGFAVKKMGTCREFRLKVAP